MLLLVDLDFLCGCFGVLISVGGFHWSREDCLWYDLLCVEHSIKPCWSQTNLLVLSDKLTSQKLPLSFWASAHQKNPNLLKLCGRSTRMILIYWKFLGSCLYAKEPLISRVMLPIIDQRSKAMLRGDLTVIDIAVSRGLCRTLGARNWI